MSRLLLIQGPQGSPNFCFGLYTKIKYIKAISGIVQEPRYRRECRVFVQTDWDYAGLASSLGWCPCELCGATDGTVDCAHRKVSDMLSEAFDFLSERDGRWFDVDGYDPEVIR